MDAHQRDITVAPGVRKRTKGNYLVEAQVGNMRRAATVPTLEEAKVTRTLLKAELYASQGTPIHTLKDALEQTYNDSWAHGKDAEKALATAHRVLDYFGATTPIQDITYGDVQAFRTHLRKIGNANGTINRKTAALSSMLSTSIKYGWIATAPKLGKLPEYRGRIRVITPHEEDRLIALLNLWGKYDHADAVIVFIEMGFRMSELWHLQSRDVNFHTGLIHIWENKTEKPRSLPMSDVVLNIMKRRVSAHPDRPFPYDNGWMRNVWDRAKAEMDLEGDKEFIPYALRHTAASRLLNEGMKIGELMAWLGHKTISVTMRYAHLAADALVKGATMLNNRRKEITNVTPLLDSGVSADSGMQQHPSTESISNDCK